MFMLINWLCCPSKVSSCPEHPIDLKEQNSIFIIVLGKKKRLSEEIPET
jgi:hypothetical protein